jgi:hypothetical protein
MTKIDPYKHKQRYENWREEVDKKGGNKIKIEGGFLREECLELFK